METIATPRPGPTKLVLGLFFTMLGIVMTLDNLELFDAELLLRYWPLVLVLLGVLYLADASRRALGVFCLAFGLLLLLPRIAHLSFFSLWPLILIGIGVVIVLRALGFQTAEQLAGSAMVNVLTTRKLQVRAEELDGKRILSFMGGADLELAGPGDDPTPVAIEVLSMWGGTTLRIPPGWEVHCEAFPIMGGVENKASSTTGGRKLMVRGLVVMSGIEIKNAAPSSAFGTNVGENQ